MSNLKMENLVSLCKRRGFIFNNSEIYGGLQGVYDFGPLGVELKNNLRAAWWREMVYERDDVEGLDAAILTNKQVLIQSGHETTFSDPMVDCKNCKSRHRADHLEDKVCPNCGSSDLTEPRAFNLMLKTTLGPVVQEENYSYLRPETAQAIFTNFRNVMSTTGRRPPFGIAQTGKAFRNEITPRNFIFRVREFEQMELEFFVPKGEDAKWHDYWIEKRVDWWYRQGLSPEKLHKKEQAKEDLSHYAKRTVDIEYQFPHGIEELEGIANRTDFDLGSHSRDQDSLNIDSSFNVNTHSNTKLAWQEPNSSTWHVPYVIEPSAGLERGVLAVISEGFASERLENGSDRTVLKLKPHLAPIKVAVIPLKKNDQNILGLSTKIKNQLQTQGFGRILLETTGNIGKGYRRHDEIGTPFCVTVDFQSLEDQTVTIRDRDTMSQQRVSLENLSSFVKSNLG